MAAGTYGYTVSDANNCSVTQSATITQPGKINLATTITNLNCYNDNTGAIATIETGGISPFSFALENNGVSVQTSATGQFNNLAAGSYILLVTDANFCLDSVPALVSQPNLLTNNIDSTNVTCFGLSNGQVQVLPVGGTPSFTFALSNGTTNGSGLFNNLFAGTYSITITDAHGCTAVNNVIITQPDSFLISVSPVQSVVKLGDTLQLNASSNQPDSVFYVWTPSNGLSCDDCPNPVFNNVYSATYYITGTSSNGCKTSYEISVTVIPDYNLFIPNAFTPNGDGKNDVWQMFGELHNVKQFAVKVFNRWGELVYEGQDVTKGWDGTYKGGASPEGVYVYEISLVWLDNRGDDHYQGSITLLR